MARLEALVVGADRPAREIEVADRVEHLMPDEFVRKSQAVWIADALAIHHNGVVEVCSKRMPTLHELGVVGGKAERARRSDLSLQKVAVPRCGDRLHPQRRAWVIDRYGQPRVEARAQPHIAVTLAHL